MGLKVEKIEIQEGEVAPGALALVEWTSGEKPVRVREVEVDGNSVEIEEVRAGNWMVQGPGYRSFERLVLAFGMRLGVLVKNCSDAPVKPRIFITVEFE